jgi:hypothetical protein
LIEPGDGSGQQDTWEIGVDWFLALLALTTIVRGLGAGMIWDVALVGLPARRRIGAIPYATFARANFEVNGLKTYGPVSIVGFLLTVAVTVSAIAQGESAPVTWHHPELRRPRHRHGVPQRPQRAPLR